MLSHLKALLGCETNKTVTALRYIAYRLQGRRIIASSRARIRGVSNITTSGPLYIGTERGGLAHPKQWTVLDVRGSLIFKSYYSIGRGCVLDIGPGAVCQFGNGYVNCDTKFVIRYGLKVGEGTAIAWGCQFLNSDFHHLDWEGRQARPHNIEIGDHVWIGCNVVVLKGVRIANNVVVAANSVVTRSCDEEHVMLAGSPARIVKRNVTWSLKFEPDKQAVADGTLA